MKLNVSGKLYEVVAYHVRPRGRIVDMEEVEPARERAPAEGDRGRLVRLSAASSTSPPSAEIADSVDAKLMVDMAHFAGLVAAGEHRTGRARARHHDTIHKTLCGPRSGMILCTEELAKDIDRSVFPGQQGGPLMHVIAAKAVALGIAASEAVQGPPAADDANARALAEGLEKGGVGVLTGGTDVHLVLVDLRPPASTARPPRTASNRSGSRQPQPIPFDERPPMNPSGLRIGTRH